MCVDENQLDCMLIFDFVREVGVSFFSQYQLNEKQITFQKYSIDIEYCCTMTRDRHLFFDFIHELTLWTKSNLLLTILSKKFFDTFLYSDCDRSCCTFLFISSIEIQIKRSNFLTRDFICNRCNTHAQDEYKTRMITR